MRKLARLFIVFIFVMQDYMALNMNLNDEYLQRMGHNEERFLKEGNEA